MQRSLSCMTRPSLAVVRGLHRADLHARRRSRSAGRPAAASASPGRRHPRPRLVQRRPLGEDAVPPHAQRHVVLALADDRAGPAADAPLLVHDHAPAGMVGCGPISPHARDAGESASTGETLSPCHLPAPKARGHLGVAAVSFSHDLAPAVLPAGGRRPHVAHEVDLVDRVDRGRGELVDALAARELAGPPALVEGHGAGRGGRRDVRPGHAPRPGCWRSSVARPRCRARTRPGRDEHHRRPAAGDLVQPRVVGVGASGSATWSAARAARAATPSGRGRCRRSGGL